MRKKTFQSLGRSNYQCAQCEFTCQVRNNPIEEQTNSSFLKCDPRIYIFEEMLKRIRDVIGNVYCPTLPAKCVFTFQPTKFLVSTTVKSTKPALMCLIFLLRTKRQQLCWLVEMAHIALQKNESRLRKRKTISSFEFYPPITIKHTEPVPVRQKSFHLRHNGVDSPLVDTVNRKIISILILYASNLQ